MGTISTVDIDNFTAICPLYVRTYINMRAYLFVQNVPSPV